MDAKVEPSPGAVRAAKIITDSHLVNLRNFGLEVAPGGVPDIERRTAEIIDENAVAPAVESERQSVDGRLADLLNAEKARADALARALEPFAKVADCLAKSLKGKSDTPLWSRGSIDGEALITVGHVEAARAALKAHGGK